jgi:hypothetical protein
LVATEDPERAVIETLRFAMRIWSIGLAAMILTMPVMGGVEGDTAPLVELGPRSVVYFFLLVLLVTAFLAERWLRRGLRREPADLRRGMIALAAWLGFAAATYASARALELLGGPT